MPDDKDDRQLRERIRRIDSLLAEVERFKDPQDAEPDAGNCAMPDGYAWRGLWSACWSMSLPAHYRERR